MKHLIELHIALSRRFPDHAFAVRPEEQTQPALHLRERGLYDKSLLQLRNEYMQKELKIKNWMPSSPKVPSKFNMNVHTKNGSLTGMGSLELYPFAWLFNLLTEGTTIKWVSETQVVTSDDIRITSDYLEEIAEYTFKGDEKLWSPPSPYREQWHKLKHGTPPERQTPAGSTQTKREAPRQERPTKPRPAEGEALQAICERLSVDPGKARAKLRKANEPKPYVWPPEDVPRIEALIKR